MEITKPKKVDKPWGHELWVYNAEEYCGKLLVFEKEQAKFSMHYHIIKKESWFTIIEMPVKKWVLMKLN